MKEFIYFLLRILNVNNLRAVGSVSSTVVLWSRLNEGEILKVSWYDLLGTGGRLKRCMAYWVCLSLVTKIKPPYHCLRDEDVSNIHGPAEVTVIEMDGPAHSRVQRATLIAFKQAVMRRHYWYFTPVHQNHATRVLLSTLFSMNRFVDVFLLALILFHLRP